MITTYSSGQTVFGFAHIEGITMDADEVSGGACVIGVYFNLKFILSEFESYIYILSHIQI